MSVDESNKLEIDLAYNTLAWLHTLEDSEIPDYVLVRDLVSNLCDFQDRFANPMAFPLFESNPNKPSRLETPRHLPALLRFKCAYELPEKYFKNSIDPLDGIVQDGKAYCFAGGELWSEVIDSGELEISEDDLNEPIISRYEWIRDLFSIFNFVKDSKKRSVARELASCWYFIATHISLDVDDEEEEKMIVTQLLSSMNLNENLIFGKNNIQSDNYLELSENSPEMGTPASIVGALMNETLENEDIQLTGNNKSLAQLLLEGLCDDDDDDEDYIPEENEEEDDDYISEEEDDQDDENINEFVDKFKFNLNNEDKREEDHKENPLEVEFRSLVLETVESLSSYLPTNKEWLERVLSTAKSMEQEKKLWFPWGFPPMEKIKKSLKSEDEFESKYSSKLVDLLSES